jgi:hypothetical protein
MVRLAVWRPRTRAALGVAVLRRSVTLPVRGTAEAEGVSIRAAALHFGRAQQGRLPRRVDALLGFQAEAPAPIEVGPAGRGGVIPLAVGDAALIAIIPERAGGGVWSVDTDKIAELTEKARITGALRLLGSIPSGDEGTDGVAVGRAVVVWHRRPCGLLRRRPCRN